MNGLILWSHVLNVEIRQRLRRTQIVVLRYVLDVKTSSVQTVSLDAAMYVPTCSK